MAERPGAKLAKRQAMRALIAAALMLGPGPAARAGEGQVSSDAEAVRAAFESIQKAVESRDTARLAELIHPRFAMLHALGQTDSREAWFALVKSGRLPRQNAERRELQSEVVVAGDTALIRSLVQMSYRSEGRTSWMRSAAVFIREGGRWVQINQQSSYLYDGPASAPVTLHEFARAFAIPGREGFTIVPRDGYVELVWRNGAILPLLPIGADRFVAGPTSSIWFVRDSSGRITGAERVGDDGRVWWTAKAA